MPWVIQSYVHAQRVHHLDINNGLCHNSLTDLTLDRKGNMWIGSYDGLMKYSGTRIKCMVNVGRDNASISGPEMHSITEDQCGFIWIGTTAGLDKIHPITFEVEHYPIRSPFPGSTFVGYIYAVFADRYDYIWLSTDVALFRLDMNTGGYELVPVQKDSKGIPDHRISYNGFVETDEGLWFYTDGGMVFFDYHLKTYFHKYHNPQSQPIFELGSGEFGSQSDLKQDGNGRLWFTLEEELLVSYDIPSGQIDTFRFELPRGVWPCCRSIGIDAADNIWIGFRHGGIKIFNTTDQSFTTLREGDVKRLIRSDYIYSIEKSWDGKMFVATDNGLDIIDIYDLSLRERTLSNRADFLNLKYQACEITFNESQTELFIPFLGFGFFRYDLRLDTFSMYPTDAYLGGGTAYIYAGEGKQFVGIHRNLFEFEWKDSSISVHEDEVLPEEVTSARGQVVWYVKEPDGSAIVKKGGGSILHIKEGEVEVLKGVGFKPNICLSLDRRFFYYLTPQLNLARRNLEQLQEDTVYLQEILEKSEFSFANPRHMADDGRSIWITGQNGMLRYDYSSQKLHTYSMENGLSHSFTFSVVLDKQNNIWVGSLGGIDRYMEEGDHFASMFKIKNNTYMEAFGDAVCSATGELFFHFGNKLIRILPDQIDLPGTGTIPVRLHEVRVNGQNIDWSDPHRLAHLHYKENRMTFIYDLMLNDDSDLVTYQYRLNEGPWINNEHRNEINLAGLTDGSYQLEVRGAVGSRIDTSPVLTIPFHINPPWWNQWWFVSLLVAAMVSAVWFYIRGRMNTLRNELQVSLQIAELESKALKAQMNPHFVFNSLNAIQECIMTGRVEEAYTYLSRFSRLLRMVLEQSEQQEIKLQDELEVLNLYVSLEKLRFKDDMQYHFTLEDDLDVEEIRIPPMLIQPHLENAIWHGLRHKRGDKHLMLTMTEKQPGYLDVQIEDNGIGIKRSTELRQTRLGKSGHTSKGKKMSENRIILLRKTYPLTTMEIIDLYDEQGRASGTKVLMTIPMLEKKSGLSNTKK